MLFICIISVILSTLLTVLIYRTGIHDGITLSKGKNITPFPYEKKKQKSFVLENNTEDYRNVLKFNGEKIN